MRWLKTATATRANRVLGTSGNFSAMVSREPLRLAITSTGLDKGGLTREQFLEIDNATRVVRGEGRPSAEALLHLAIVRTMNAGAVLPGLYPMNAETKARYAASKK